MVARQTPRGYFPEPNKNILVVSTHKFLQTEAFFCGYGLEIVTGGRYLGGFVGMEATQAQWVEDKVEAWRSFVGIISGVACKQPQTSYAVLHKCMQKKWYFVQRVTLYIEKAFQPVEDALQEALLLALFRGATSQINRKAVTGLPVR